MALFKCSLCVCSLLVAGMVGVDANKLTKNVVPNGAQPFSIGVSVNPLAKVISMIQAIKDEVDNEGVDEDRIFANFACFCKDKTKRLTHMVNHHSKLITKKSSDIADWTARTNNFRSDHVQRTKDHEEFSTSLDDYQRRLKEENADWLNIENTFANDKALIKQAIGSMKNSGAGAFLQGAVSAVDKLKGVLDIADAMGFVVAPKHKAAAASFLEGTTHGSKTLSQKHTEPEMERYRMAMSLSQKHTEPEMEGYSYHTGSNDIVDLVQSVWGQMQTLRNTQEEAHAKASSSYRSMVQSLRRKIEANHEAMHDIEHSESKMKEDTAEARGVLIEEKSDLQDTEAVLSQITTACENRATEYDARSAARIQELRALNTAMACLASAHKSAVDQAKAALLQKDVPVSKSKALPAPSKEVKAKAPEKAVTKATQAKAEEPQLLAEAALSQRLLAEAKAAQKPISFLQTNEELSQDDRKRKAINVIRSEGRRTKSLMLTALALSTHLDDPFAKVIKLITDLRWRLEKEEHAELSKEVWCRENVLTAEHESNAQYEKAKELSAEVLRLEAKIDELKSSVYYHHQRAVEIGLSLTEIFTDISQLSKHQMTLMSVQKDARDDIKEAIMILKSYYSQSAKVASHFDLVQVDGAGDPPTMRDQLRSERRSIHTENSQRADAEDVREGKRAEKKRQRIGDLDGSTPSGMRQGALGDALALMETIVSDFDREIGNLEGDLDAEHKELVATNQVLTSQKMKQEELRDLDKQDLKTARVNRKVRLENMKTAMNLADDAFKELETLKPTCIDTGMSYAERVAARKVEMTALTSALCILGETNEKYGCPP